MKVLIINSVCGIRSTGRICTDTAKILIEEGHECKIAYGREYVPAEFEDISYRIGDDSDVRFHALMTRVMDNTGAWSRKATEKFVRWIEEYDPDIIHLHNIHGYYINIEVLFRYLQRADKPVVFTLHDCWSFTGHCAHFAYIGCDKWKTQCEHCSQKAEYPKSSFADNSRQNYQWKRELFTGIENMTIVTPSRWLADLVKESYLKKYDVRVIHNGIDLNAFRPMVSDVKSRLGLENKKIILGVASSWNDRKGLSDYLELAKIIEDEYVIMLVGVTEAQKKTFPDNVIGITCTDSVKELAEIYSAADVFVNLTYEDTFPTVNLEAYACNTPVITYHTGGSVESTPNELVVEQGDLSAVWELIKDENYHVDFQMEVDKNKCLRKYYELYQELISRK